MLLTMNETYQPVLLRRRAAKLRRQTGNQLLRTRTENSGQSTADHLKLAVVRPLKLLVRSPILVLTSLYVAIGYGYMYVMFTSMTEVFQDTYGFRTEIVGLMYVGLGVGCLLGTAIYSGTSDRYIRRKSAERRAAAAAEGHGEEEAGLTSEYRLFLIPLGTVLLPVGLFLYGSLQPGKPSFSPDVFP